MTLFSATLKQFINFSEGFFGDWKFNMNPPAGGGVVTGVLTGLDLVLRDIFPAYVPGGNNQPYLTHLAIILERDRTLNRDALTRYSLGEAGHRFLREYIRDTNPTLYQSVYVDVNAVSGKPGY